MTEDLKTPNQKNPDQQTDASISRRAMAKKAAYVAPAVLAVIAMAERPALAQSSFPG